MNSIYSLCDYWNDFHGAIAKVRKWKNPVATYSYYNNMMKNLSDAAPETITKTPIGELSSIDITLAIRAVHSKEKKDVNTLLGYASLINDIINYYRLFHQSMYGVINYNNELVRRNIRYKLSDNTDGKKAESKKHSRQKSTADINQAEDDFATNWNLRKSLSLTEMRTIMKFISAHLLEDGRFIALAIMIYTGVRPAECRALCWEDIDFIPGHMAKYFEIHKVLDEHNNPNEPKTANGYRNIPIHAELQSLLTRWEKFICKEKQIESIHGNGMPPHRGQLTGYICCNGNDFGKPCKYHSLASFAKEKVFPMLNPDLIEAATYDWSIAKKDKSIENDPEDNITLYVLRRNFWTWMQYATPCTRLEKLYVMGHKMDAEGKNMRSCTGQQKLDTGKRKIRKIKTRD